MRLFVALDMPEELQDRIHRLQIPVRDLKWEPPERLHLTLQFLGEQPEQRLPELFEALAAVEFEPFELCCQGIGHFRSGAIWLGIEPNDRLRSLHRQIGARLRETGIAFESRRFSPHITLARTARQRLLPALDTVAERFQGISYRFECDTFCLKSSLLRPTGALHRVEALFAAA
ncbi:RNA 2',3'-cyclic phosphodiesterase [Marinobacterium nitratireducens]|uniref:RNA 2',3'-cyclic phosphodiesterase n=1 Tax=Marinobacterium nitratireducens TaxID=518897 RepID=A0A917Z616_9GAMM|nr:RNA 2',3'-cyclic phosphodiesterase [Marinobacterium nitratireducens]GGO76080.1 RNA 2',3'-cyclic phosphodiesterase [Marinobacterium nitratireducens]